MSDRAHSEIQVELLTDGELLSLCEIVLDPVQQDLLSELLARQKDGPLPLTDRSRLDELLAAYRAGLLLKASAIKEAVTRGLRPSVAADHSQGGHTSLRCAEQG